MEERIMRITVLSINSSDAKTLAESAYRLTEIGITPKVYAINSYDADDDILIYQELYKSVLQSDYVFVRSMSDPSKFKRFDRLTKALEECPGNVLVYSGNVEVTLVNRYLFKGSDEELGKLCQYCANRSRTNDYGMYHYAAYIRGLTDIVPPEPVSERLNGVYHKGTDRDITKEEYLKTLDPEKPTAAILFSAAYWQYDNLAHIDGLVDALEKKGMNTLPVFYANPKYRGGGVTERPEVLNYFLRDGKVIPDVLINIMASSLSGKPKENGGVGTNDEDNYYHTELNIPVIQCISVTGDYHDYEDDKIGLNKRDMSINVTSAEVDGHIIGYPVCYTPKKSGMKKALPIIDRAERTADLAYSWAKLRKTPLSKRKVAILLWQSRPNSGCIGNSAGLDTPESVANIIRSLSESGYSVDHVPEGSREMVNEILDGVTNDLDNMSTETMREKAVDLVQEKDYKNQFDAIPEWDQEMMRKDWGEPPGTICVDGMEIIIPGIINGNVFVGYQPMRGWAEKMEQNIHDPVMFAQHQYLAYYRWIRDVFKADMVIHVGTHGTIEWLPGKNVGMSVKCDPDVVLGGLPNLYPYIIDDPGEGIQAKRRINSVLIGHMPPSMARAGQYEEIAEVEIPLQDYFKMKNGASKDRVEILVSKILDCAKEHDLLKDMDLPDDITPAEFEEHVIDLHEYLSEVKDALIRADLHVLGNVPRGEHFDETIYSLMRLDNGEIRSLRDSFADNVGIDIQKAIDDPTGSQPNGELNSETVERIDSELQKFLEHCRNVDYDYDGCIEFINDLHGKINDDLKTCIGYVCSTLVPNIRKMDEEIGNMLDAIDGQYVLPGPSGAPTRGNAHILPMGRNFYGLDPNTVPSKASWEIGKIMADQMIEKYTSEKGEFPREVGFIIWATDTMKTGGDDVAYILWLMGVKPVWSKAGGQVVDLEVVPLEELKRPRVDVTVNITGLFRDTFPNLIDLIDYAVKMVAALDESDEDNCLAANLRKDIVEGIAEGLTPDEARRRNLVRMFGAPPGGYGAGTNKAIESGAWKTVEDLANVYMDWCSNGYEKGNYGQKMKTEFIRRFSKVGVTVKNMPDREVDLIDCDDVYQFLGGMNAFVRAYGRKDAVTYMGDGSDPKKTKIRSTKDELRFVFRSKVLNPKFISGLKEHGYKGAMEMANLTEFTMAWGATSDIAEDWMYEGITDKFLLDEDTREWMKDVNPYAMMNILNRLQEAIERGLWNATDEYKEKIKDLFLETEERIEEITDR